MKTTFCDFLTRGGVILSFLMLAGCSDAVKSADSPDFPDVCFHVEPGAETVDGATVTVTHDGSDRDTYYGFATKDLDSGVDALVNRKTRELSGTENLSGSLKSGSTRIINVEGLESGTAYRYVVFGMNPDGSIYGTPGSCSFSTVKGIPKFTLSVMGSPTDNNVFINISTTGDNTDKWYAFVTTDLTSSAESLCEKELRSVPDLGQALESGSIIKEFPGLSQNTTYRAVVTGVRDGAAYGTPATVEFTTRMRPVYPVLNPDWTVTYEGPGTITNGDYTGTYKQVISCVSTSREMYFIVVISKESMDYYKDQFDVFLTDAAAFMTDYIRQYNQAYGTDYTWADFGYTTSAREGYNLTKEGIYTAYAVGVEMSGAPTGKYAASEPFEVAAPPMSDAYKAWIGSWRIGDGKIDYDVTIVDARDKGDNLYHLRGWEASADLSECPAVAMLDENTGELVFISCDLADVYLRDGGTDVACTLGFYGSSGNDVFIAGAGSSYNIAVASFSGTGNDNAIVNPESVNTSEGRITIGSMGYYARNKSTGELYTFSSAYPQMPFTMTRTGSSPASAPSGFSVRASAGPAFPVSATPSSNRPHEVIVRGNVK